MCAKGYNLPDNVSPNDPDAPWNQTAEAEEPEIEDEIELVCLDEQCGWEGTIEAAAMSSECEYLCPVCGGSAVDADKSEDDDTDITIED